MNATTFPSDDYTPIFNNKSTRSAFIGKVFSIVQAQLLFTAAAVIVMQNIGIFSRLAEYLLLPAAIVGIGSALALTFSRSLARTTPHNYILLGAFTLAESILVNSTLSVYSLETISHAFFATALLVGAVYVAAKKSNFDITNSRFFTYVAMFHLAVVLLSAFIMRIDQILMAYVGALMFCAYLYFDLQLLMGDRAKAVSIDDYIFASINIYVDIVGLFVKLVQIFGEQERKKKEQEQRRRR